MSFNEQAIFIYRVLFDFVIIFLDYCIGLACQVVVNIKVD